MAIDSGRRKFAAALGIAVAWPLAARAQQAGSVKRLGILQGGVLSEIFDPLATPCA